MNRRASLLTALLLATSLGVGSTGCQLIASADRDEIELDGPDAGTDPEDDAGAGGQGGSGGDGGSGGNGGDGGTGGGDVCDDDVQVCATDNDCSSLSGACAIGVCDNGCCRQAFKDAGEIAPADAQTPGDCQRLTCDGQGGTKTGWDDTDLPEVTECWIPKCFEGAAANEAKALGEACDGGAKICDGAGNCVDPGCTNNVKDGNETDVDCGGPGCAPCADNSKCDVGSDCENRVCDDILKTCTPAACDDGIENGDEAGVDCGGSNCLACDDATCTDHVDCKSGFCNADSECKQPTCSDGEQNGGETGIDCGGDCLACDEDTCADHADCKSGFCNADSECKQPTCNDGEQNGGETGIDCGGSCEFACDDEACADHADCKSGFCNADSKCKQPTCDDGLKNGTETGIDCGPGCPLACDDEACTDDAACKSGFCNADNECKQPTCSDGVKNGNEKDVDCVGEEDFVPGGECLLCLWEFVCLSGADCKNGCCDVAGAQCSEPPWCA